MRIVFPTNPKIVKKDLDPVRDEADIRQWELDGMIHYWNLTTRLIYYYETGVDVCLDKLSEFYPDEYTKYLKIFQEKFGITY